MTKDKSRIPRKSDITNGTDSSNKAAPTSMPKKAKWSPSKSRKKNRKKEGSSRKTGSQGGSSRVFTTAAANGTMITFVKKPKAEEAAVIYPITMKMRKHGSVMNNMMVDFVANRRNTNGTNEPMFQSDKSSYSFPCFVTVFDNANENTAANRKSIVTERMLPIMNDIGKDVNPIRKEKYSYFNSFTYAGDTAPSILHCPARYLLNHDVVKIMEKLYPSMSLTELAEDDNIVASFYGNDRINEGWDIMTSIDNESDASLAEQSEDEED